jgi:hypothetical protein
MRDIAFTYTAQVASNVAQPYSIDDEMFGIFDDFSALLQGQNAIFVRLPRNLRAVYGHQEYNVTRKKDDSIAPCFRR